MNNYIMHYGVKGMKWGVRNDPQRSMRGNLHRALAGVYGINERYYGKRSGKRNRTLASMNSAARKEQLKRASIADKNKSDRVKQKQQLNKILQNENQKRQEGLRKVDPKLAKNTTTRRVAQDYHRLTNAEFMGKYKTTKKIFAKRYVKSDGDTFSQGLKKQAIAMKWLGASNSSVMKATVNSIAAEKTTDKGHEYAGNIMRAVNDEYIKKNTPAMNWNGGFVSWNKR